MTLHAQLPSPACVQCRHSGWLSRGMASVCWIIRLCLLGDTGIRVCMYVHGPKINPLPWMQVPRQLLGSPWETAMISNQGPLRVQAA